ncbi:MAG: ribonuclease H-like domain-containing protein, partial [Planctomycetota bacterium]
MSDLHDRLRRQRRDPPRAVTSPEPRAASGRPLPEWLRRNLGARSATTMGAAATTGVDAVVDEPLELVSAPGGWCARTRDFRVEHRHGDWPLGDVLVVDRDFAARFTGDDALLGFDFRNAVYLDIEATGLSGGAGTIPFLVALGTFEETSFRLWQGFLRGPEDEAALLDEVARRVRAASGVVSFFGKSYDRHRLEDKMRLYGIAPPFDATPHLDLYHPLARLVKGTLPDAKLQRLERELCGVTRSDDLPGSFAPAAWFDFLRRRPHRLEDVFRHNEDDVLSLVVLAAHLGSTERGARA